jgi:hypothetical protein
VNAVGAKRAAAVEPAALHGVRQRD